MKTDRRQAFLRAVDHFVPSAWGDDVFVELVNGRWAPDPTSGTTCGYLPAAALYLAGARDNRLVNYDDPEGLTRWEVAQGISKLFGGAKAVGAWVDDAPGVEPQEGDVLFYSSGPPATEHVEIFRGLTGRTLQASAAGQGSRARQEVKAVERDVEDTRETGGTRTVSAPLETGGEGYRKLMGWVDLDRVPWAADPSGPAADANTDRKAVALAVGIGALVAMLFGIAWLRARA